MRVLMAILGLLTGLIMALLLCGPIYEIVCRGAAGKGEGAQACFVVVFVPMSMLLGAASGAFVGGRMARRD